MTTLSRLALCLIFAAASFAMPLPVSAQTTPGAPKLTHSQIAAIRKSCHADFVTNCPGVTPKGRAALQCLAAHLSALSPPCQAAVDAAE